YLDGVPSKGLPFGNHRLPVVPWRQAVLYRLTRPAVLLQAVEVQDGGQIIGFVPGGDESRLPNLALLALAVTYHHPAMPAFAQSFRANSHTQSWRQSLPQRAGGHVETRQARHVGVALQARVDGVEGHQLFTGEVASGGHCRIQGNGGMTLREDEAVAV